MQVNNNYLKHDYLKRFKPINMPSKTEKIYLITTQSKTAYIFLSLILLSCRERKEKKLDIITLE